jgi:hypothetical protein
MLTFVLCGILGYLIARYITEPGSFDRGFSLFMGGFLGLAGGFLLAGGIGIFLPTKFVEAYKLDLVAMRSDTGGQSSFFLFGAQNSMGWEYRFYVSDGELLRPDSLTIDDNNVYILQTDDSPPQLKISQTEFTESWYNWIAIRESDRMYTFVVPTGSVVEKFEL